MACSRCTMIAITTERPGWISPPRQPFSPEHAVARPRPKQQDREREHHVERAGDERVDPAAVEAGDDARGSCPRITDRPVPMKRHRQRDLRAVEHAREDVAADRVDAEEVVAARPFGEPEVVERGRLLDVRRAAHRRSLRDRAGEDRHEDQDDDEAQGDQRDLVPTEAPPEQLERRARGNGRLAADHRVEARVLRVQKVACAGARAHAGAPRLTCCGVQLKYLLRARAQTRDRRSIPLKTNNLQGRPRSPIATAHSWVRRSHGCSCVPPSRICRGRIVRAARFALRGD